MFRIIVKLCVHSMFVLLGPRGGVAVEINFDDGLGHEVAIDAFYVSLGVTFSNTHWSNNVSSEPGATPPFTIQAFDSGTPYASVFDEAHALVGTFSTPVSEVIVTGIDVGVAGAGIRVYDAVEGGNAIAFDSFSGPDSGVGNFGDLHVTIAGIRRFELFQPFDNPLMSDGLAFDNLRFTLAGLIPGDGNGDGWVDGLDYLLWAGNFGTHPGADGDVSDGDYNDDGWVDGLDYLEWAGNFGTHAATNVPEPMACAMLVCGAIMIVAGRNILREE